MATMAPRQPTGQAGVNPATPISIKVEGDYYGEVRRVKLPLGDLKMNLFEDKLREVLGVPIGDKIVIERFSDSAASYVVLEPYNEPVHKQMQRAARAKQRLKLRISHVPKTSPKPVTVEDEPETAPAALPESSKLFPATVSLQLAETPVEKKPEERNESPVVSGSVKPAIWPTFGAPPPEAPAKKEVKRDIFSSNPPSLLDSDFAPPLAYQSLAYRSRPADLEPFYHQIKKTEELTQQKSTAPPAASQPAQKSSTPTLRDALARHESLDSFRICCNSCDKSVRDVHYHCAVCDCGDFDLCQECVDMGITCYGSDHWLIKRTLVSGDIVSSTTERITPSKATKKESAIPSEKLFEVQPVRRRGPAPLNDTFPELAPASQVTPLNPWAAWGSSQWAAAEDLSKYCPFGAAAGERSCAISGPAAQPQQQTQQPPAQQQPIGVEMRTCNNCIDEFPEKHFMHCTTCEDFDLCHACFVRNNHGHHPKHAFEPISDGPWVTTEIKALKRAGRSVSHNAICDGCDKFIRGIRHKCLDCPDWDYCDECFPNTKFIHAGHRFVSLYEPLADPTRPHELVYHGGVRCDGPLCRDTVGCIQGDRYKCAVCPDTDFCAACEASPSNTHNKTHPVIKFRTPVKHVHVTTKGEQPDGATRWVRGDAPERAFPADTKAEPEASRASCSSITPIQNICDVAPADGKVTRTSPASSDSTERPALKQVREAMDRWQADGAARAATLADLRQKLAHYRASHPASSSQPLTDVQRATLFEQSKRSIEKLAPPAERKTPEELEAVYVRDTVADGSAMDAGSVFEQTWILRNEGSAAWPIGCVVRYAGGDYMCNIDTAAPVSVQDLESTSRSNATAYSVNPGETYSFTVKLRAPANNGRAISYWRLQTPKGERFGNRLWCDIAVVQPKVVEKKVEAEEKPAENKTPEAEEKPTEAEVKAEPAEEKASDSVMIFPKLEKESPEASVHEEASSKDEAAADAVADTFEDCVEDDDWENDSIDVVLTEDEYDILDASDEEWAAEQERK